MKQFIVETSARHVHVTQQDLETLFGKGYELTVKKMLSQPGQYASAERVDVVGPKKTLTGVSILGPVRSATQVASVMMAAKHNAIIFLIEFFTFLILCVSFSFCSLLFIATLTSCAFSLPVFRSCH